MTDPDTLVARLRTKAGVMEMGERIAWGSDTALMYEASSALEAAQAAREAAEAKAARLEEALKPFAKYASENGFGLDFHGRELPDSEGVGWIYLTNGDFRRARAALGGRE